MALKFYTNVVKGLKINTRTFCGLNLTSVEVTGEKLVGMFFALNYPEYSFVSNCWRGSNKMPQGEIIKIFKHFLFPGHSLIIIKWTWGFFPKFAIPRFNLISLVWKFTRHTSFSNVQRVCSIKCMFLENYALNLNFLTEARFQRSDFSLFLSLKLKKIL